MEAIIGKVFPFLAITVVPDFAPALLVFGLLVLLRGRK